MVLHRHRQHQSQLDADAIPILQASDELPLLYQDDYMLPRRKRHSGGEYSRSNSNSGDNNASSSDSTNAAIASYARRRGRSVPCDSRVGAIDSVDSTNVDSSDRDRRNRNGAVPFVRTRAGSAAAALMSSGRTRTGSLAAATQTDRRRAASGVLRHFRRRKDNNAAPSLVFPPPSLAQQRANRRVHFVTTLHPEVMPHALVGVPSYDELLFNVGGLYQTLSFLHDPLPLDDCANTDSSSGSHAFALDDSLPPERSMQLMIAEFLYRSAVYVGYVSENKPWLPGFRETKRFSVNDVKRWRRLAHHDWQHEEQHPPPVPATTDVSLLVTIANSCVYYGAFQFSARDIRRLCNVDIESKSAPDAA